MRIAIVSDINANRQAWDSILADTQLHGIDTFLCLGDIVGAGPAPREVLESVHGCATWILGGERDRAVGGNFPLDNFDDDARKLIMWTRSQLSRTGRRFLRELPLVMDGPGFACAHAEFEVPNRFDYLSNAATVWGSLEAAPQPVLFVGHTRLPGVHELRPNGSLKHHGVTDFVPRNGCRYLVDVGSVGDPRDGNPRASYCVLDTDTFQIYFRRVAFDVDSWAADIAAAKLTVTPFVISVLHYGQQGGGDVPPDFTAREAAGELPPVLDMTHPIPPTAINFDPAVEPAKAATKSAGKKRRRRTKAGASAVAKSATAQAVETPTAAGADTAKKKKKKKIIIGAAAAVLLLGAGIAAISGGDGDEPPSVPPAVIAEKPPEPKPNPNPKPKPPPKPLAKPEPPAGPSPEAPRVDPKTPIVPNKGLLHAKFAVINGKGTARFEAAPNRQCIGYWDSVETWVSWNARLKAGRYKVAVVQARLKPAAHEYEVSIAEQILTGEVKGTGDWGKFAAVDLGEIIIEKNGAYPVAFKPIKGGKSFINLRGIQLTLKR